MMYPCPSYKYLDIDLFFAPQPLFEKLYNFLSGCSGLGSMHARINIYMKTNR